MPDVGRAPAPGFGAFLREALDRLRAEHPEAYARMCAAIAPRSVRFVVDEETVALRATVDAIVLGELSPGAPVELATTRRAILDLADGRTSLEEALVDEHVQLRGALDDLVAFHDALLAFLHGAVRSRSFPRLLERFRSAVDDAAPAGAPHPSPLEVPVSDSPASPRKEFRSVNVFGAGVAGLTVAHELSVRGFLVTVFEAEEDVGRPELGCDVGGMARTQRSACDWPELATPSDPRSGMQPTRALVRLRSGGQPEEVPFTSGSAILDGAGLQVVAEVAETLIAHPELLAIEVYGASDGEGDAGLPLARAEAVCEALKAAGVQSARIDVPRLKPYVIDPADDLGRPAAERNVVVLSIRQHVLAGEHGFRFFPAFYWHVFDTMKRTPLLDAVPKDPVLAASDVAYLRAGGETDRRALDEARRTYVTSHRTVFDNLVPTNSQALAVGGEPMPPILPRQRVRTFEAVRRGLRILFDDMRFTARDLAQLELKLFKYLTSSTARRAREYERLSWWEFIEGDRFTPACRDALDRWPQALVAMSARDGDARTEGNIAVQLLIDQLVDGTFRDATLNAPTSDAWLDPWRKFLERQGVTFKRARLKGIDYDFAPGGGLLPDVDSTFLDGYIVIALPVAEAQRIITRRFVEQLLRYEREVRPGMPPTETLQRIRDFPLGNTARAQPDGPLQHLSGIQFYFEEDIQWVDGHTYYPNSDWGLTSISQATFWERRHDWRDGHRGTLSVCIANWFRPSAVTGRCAWESSRDEIAGEVWRQISEGIANPDHRPPMPLYYHLDDNIRFGDRGGRSVVQENRSPLLINRKDEWRRRPGRPGAYEVMFDQLVFAGTFMQTHTRLTTMEAANESGRHAANAILSHARAHEPSGREGNPCDIFPPEERELEDLAYLKELDERLVARGLPHFVDVLELESVPEWILPGGSAPGWDMVLTKVREWLAR